MARGRETVRKGTVPDIVIRRLPLYLRALRQLYREGREILSSQDLARHLGLTAAQIRRDLSYFGRFGKQGRGYAVASLIHELEHALQLDRTWDVALVGYGNLGQAIAQYRGFRPNGFRIAAIFAKHPEHVGLVVNGLVVLPETEIERVVRELGIRIGIIAVPPEAAQDVADRLVAGGVRAILNYAPVTLHVPAGVIVREIDPVSLLQSMTYYLQEVAVPAEDNGQARHDLSELTTEVAVVRRPVPGREE